MADVKVQTREDRLRAALRENLKRRKARARGRTPSDEASGPVGRGSAREDPPDAPEEPSGPKVPTD